MTFEIKKGELTDREQKSIRRMLIESKTMFFDKDKAYKETDLVNGVHSFKVGTKNGNGFFEYRLVKVYFNSKKSA